MAKDNTWLIIAVIAVGVILFMNGKGDNNTGTGTGTGTGGTPPSVIVNPTPITNTLTVNMYDKHNRATNLGSNNAKVYRNGVLASSSVVHSGTVAVAPGEAITIYAGENSTTYYTKKVELVAKNQVTDVVDISACKIDTGVSIVYFNEQDQPNTNITIGAGGTEDANLRIRASSDTCYGNPDLPKSAGVGLQYNTSAFSSVNLGGADKVSCPSFLSESAGFTWKCYEFDYLEDGNAKDFENTLTFTAVGAVNPSPLSLFNVTVQVIDKDYDFNALTDAVIMDYEDESNNDLGDTTSQLKMLGFI